MLGKAGVPAKSQPKVPYASTRSAVLKPIPGRRGADEPIIDLNFSDEISAKRYHDFHGANINIEKTPPLPPIEMPTFKAIFDKKVAACKQLCNFVYIDADVKAKAIKQTTLEQLLAFLKNEEQAEKLQQEEANKLLDMIAVNICRSLPTPGDDLLFQESCPNILIPQWQHTSIVYDILLQMLRLYPQYFSLEFVDRILYMLNSSDANERTRMKFFVGGFCMQQPEYREQMTIRMVKMIVDHQNRVIPPFSIGSILEILLEMFNWEGQNKDLNSVVFCRYIAPLVADSYLTFFMKELASACEYFMRAAQKHVNVVVDTIIKYWPRTRLSKQIFLLNVLTSAIPHLSQRDFSQRIPKIFPIYSECLRSPSSKLAEASLAIWDSLEVQAILGIFAKQVFPLVVPAMLKVSKEHWAESVRRIAARGMSFVVKTDSKFNAEAISSLKAIDKEEQNKWITITKTAAAKDNQLNLEEKIAEIEVVFSEKEYYSGPMCDGKTVTPVNMRSLPRIVTPKLLPK